MSDKRQVRHETPILIHEGPLEFCRKNSCRSLFRITKECIQEKVGEETVNTYYNVYRNYIIYYWKCTICGEENEVGTGIYNEQTETKRTAK